MIGINCHFHQKEKNLYESLPINGIDKQKRTEDLKLIPV